MPNQNDTFFESFLGGRGGHVPPPDRANGDVADNPNDAFFQNMLDNSKAEYERRRKREEEQRRIEALAKPAKKQSAAKRFVQNATPQTSFPEELGGVPSIQYQNPDTALEKAFNAVSSAGSNFMKTVKDITQPLDPDHRPSQVIGRTVSLANAAAGLPISVVSTPFIVGEEFPGPVGKLFKGFNRAVGKVGELGYGFFRDVYLDTPRKLGVISPQAQQNLDRPVGELGALIAQGIAFSLLKPAAQGVQNRVTAAKTGSVPHVTKLNPKVASDVIADTTKQIRGDLELGNGKGQVAPVASKAAAKSLQAIDVNGVSSWGDLGQKMLDSVGNNPIARKAIINHLGTRWKYYVNEPEMMAAQLGTEFVDSVRAPAPRAVQPGLVVPPAATLPPVREAAQTIYGELKKVGDAIAGKVRERQQRGVEVTPQEAQRIVTETVKEVPLETPGGAEFATGEGPVRVVTNQKAVLDNLIRGQEDIAYKRVPSLGNDANGNPIRARFEWDYKKQEATIYTTSKTTAANLSHELGHYFDQKLSSDVQQRFSDMLPDYSANKEAVDAALTKFAVESLDGNATPRQITRQIQTLATDFQRGIETLAAGETRGTRAEKFAAAVSEVIQNPNSARQRAPSFSRFINGQLAERGFVAERIQRAVESSRERIATDNTRRVVAAMKAPQPAPVVAATKVRVARYVEKGGTSLLELPNEKLTLPELRKKLELARTQEKGPERARLVSATKKSLASREQAAKPKEQPKPREKVSSRRSIAEYVKKRSTKFRAEEPKLTTKIVETLKSQKGAVSKQFIDDLTNQGSIRQAERELVRSLLKEYKDGEKIDAAEFAARVQQELLPLEVKRSDRDFGADESGNSNIGIYENITLPAELRGDVQNYFEHLYESPIRTSAGNVHFAAEEVPGYFAHTRIEDIPGGVRRVIEVQSDLFQKGRLDGEFQQAELQPGKIARIRRSPEGTSYNATEDFSKLEPYRNTWYERIIREEIQRAAADGKEAIRFPTGETAMRVEGLGENSRWFIDRDRSMREVLDTPLAQMILENRNNTLTPNQLKVGLEISQFNQLNGDNKWVITDVLGDGKFKAVPKANLEQFAQEAFGNHRPYPPGSQDMVNYLMHHGKDVIDRYTETFDISGKVDTSNPIYRFYEKDVARFLDRTRPDAKVITDPQGVTWVETKLSPKDATSPIEAFRLADTFAQFGVRISEAQVKALRALNKKLFGDTDIKVISQLMTPENQRALGSYRDSIIKVVAGQADPRATLYHEAVHKYLDAFLTTDEQVRVLQEAQRRFKTEDIGVAEERLAEAFIEYAKKREGVTGYLRTAFESILSRIQTFLGRGGDAIESFYRDLVSGKAAEAGPKPFGGDGITTKAFNEAKLNAPEDVIRTLTEVAAANDNFSAERRATTLEEMKDFAKQYLGDPDSYRTLPAEIRENIGVMKAAQQTMLDLASELTAELKSRDMKTASVAEIEALKNKLLQVEAVSKSFAGARTEASHLFSSLKSDVSAGLNDIVLRDLLGELKEAGIGYEGDLLGFLKKKKELMEPTVTDKLWHLWYANILSGPTTHAKNFIGNLSHIVAEGAREVATNPKNTSAVIGGMFKGLAEGAKRGKQILKEGELSKFEERGVKPVRFKGKLSFLNAFDYVGRALSAADALFREGFKGMERRVLIREQARREGLRGEAMTKRTAELEALQSEANVKAREIIREVGSRINLKEKTPRDERIIEEGTSAVAQLLKIDRAEARKAIETWSSVERYGDRGVYTNPPEGILGSIAGAISRVTGKKTVGGAVARFIVPFTRVVSNVLNVALDWTPAGFTRLKGEKFNLTERQRRQQLGRAVLGTVGMAYLASLAAEGRLSGNGPSDANKRQQLEAAGWRRNSVKVGDTWVPYQNWGGPFAVAMTLVGNYHDYTAYEKQQENALRRLSATTLGAVSSILDISFLSGLSDLVDSVNNRDPKFLERFVANQVTSGIPNTFKQIARMFNPTQYEASSLLEQIQSSSRITAGLKPRLNVWGEPISGDRLSGLWATKPPSDPLKDALAERGIFISFPGKTATILPRNADRRTMTDDEFYEYVKESGRRIHEDLASRLDWIRSFDAGSADDMDELLKEVRSIVDGIREDVRADIGYRTSD